MKYQICIFVLLTYVLGCVQDSDCEYQFICQNKKCIHKNLVPVNYLDILSFLFTMLIGGMSAIAGIGGGVIYVSLFGILLNMSINDAVPISQITILLGMVTKIILELVEKKKPGEKKTQINFEISGVFGPSVMVGSQFGIILNRILPAWILSILLSVIVMLTINKPFLKAIGLYRKEQLQKQNNLKKSKNENYPQIELPKMENETIIIPDNINKLKSSIIETQTIEDSQKNNTLQLESQSEKNKGEKNKLSEDQIQSLKEKYYKLENRSFPQEPFLIIFLGFAFLVIISLFRGRGGGSLVGVTSCTAWWWTLTFIFIPIAIVLTIILAFYLNKQHKEKQLIGFESKQSNAIEWSTKNLIKIIIIGIVVGVLASLLGLGGGFVVTPILLEFKIPPSTASSTGAFISIITSASATIQFLIFQLIIWDYSYPHLVAVFLGTLVSCLYLLNLIKKLNRLSYIIFMLVCLLVLAAGLSLYIGIIGIKDQNVKGTLWKIKDAC